VDAPQKAGGCQPELGYRCRSVPARCRAFSALVRDRLQVTRMPCMFVVVMPGPDTCWVRALAGACVAVRGNGRPARLVVLDDPVELPDRGA